MPTDPTEAARNTKLALLWWRVHPNMGHGGPGTKSHAERTWPSLKRRSAMRLSVRLRGKQTAREKNGKWQVMAESVTFEPQNILELKRFFEENKDKHHEIWIIIKNKKAANPQPVSFNQAISEAIKQGLIDSRTKNIDEKTYMIRFTKRIKP